MNLQPDAMAAHAKQTHRDMRVYSGLCECHRKEIFGRVVYWGSESVLINLSGTRHKILKSELKPKN